MGKIKSNLMDEEVTNVAGGGAVAGIGVGPQGEPGVNNNKKKTKRDVVLSFVRRWKQRKQLNGR